MTKKPKHEQVDNRLTPEHVGEKPTLDHAAEFLKPITMLPGFLGAVILGSVSADMQDESSDYDLTLIFSDDSLAADPSLRETQPLAKHADTVSGNQKYRKVDCSVMSLSELYSLPFNDYEAKEYIHCTIIFDHSGIVTKVASQVGHIPDEHIHQYIANSLDAYYDAVFRSLKCYRRGFIVGYHTMACRSLESMTQVLYGLQGTVSPFINRVPYLIDRLSKLPVIASELVRLMSCIASQADIAAQIELYDSMTALMEREGFKVVRDDWDGVLDQEVDLHRVPNAVAPIVDTSGYHNM